MEKKVHMAWDESSQVLFQFSSTLPQVESKPLGHLQKPSSKNKKLRVNRCPQKVGGWWLVPFL
jgi:hypothetical protein